MENMEDVRRATGIVADLSGWRGIKAEKRFEHMRLTSKERVINEEEDDETTEVVIPKTGIDMSKVEAPKEKIAQKQPQEEIIKEQKKDIKDIPATKEYTVNPIELRNLAVRLLPTAEKIDETKYEEVCEKAIDLAFTFFQVWDLKVQEVKDA